MKKKLLFTSAFLLAGLLTFAACAGPAGPEGPRGPTGPAGPQGSAGMESEMMMPGQYEVKITNLTRGQIMSPVVIISHEQKMDPLFTLGSPANQALYKVAEDAMNDDLIAMFQGDKMVSEVITLTGMAGPIMPGETATATIKAGGYISLVSMLVTTNDGQRGSA
jgi:hypothetical protein